MLQECRAFSFKGHLVLEQSQCFSDLVAIPDNQGPLRGQVGATGK